MKINKTGMLALMAAGALLAVTPALRAQDNTPPPVQSPPHAGDRLARLAEQLKLTDDQKAKVGAAMSENRATMQDIRSDTSLSADDKRTQTKAARAKLDASMKSILTPEQYEQWRKMPQHGHRPPPSGGTTNAPNSDLPKN